MRRGTRSLAIIGGVVLALAGCSSRRAAPSTTTDELQSGGRVVVYLEPLPRDADGLRFDLASVAAVAEDGARHPLIVSRTVLDSAEPHRQRVLAAGMVPLGRYRGLAFASSAASREGTGGRSDLTVAPGETVSDVPFAVEAGSVALLSAGLRVGALAGEAVSFAPGFAVGAPPAGTLAPAAIAIAALPDWSVAALFHKRTGEVLQLLATGARPNGATYDPLRGRAYVSCAGAGTVEAFDVVRGIREQVVPLQAGGRPSALALSRDGATLVVAHPDASLVTVFDAPTLTERFQVRVGREPMFVLFDRDDRRVFVVEREELAVTLVDPVRGVVVGRIATESGPTAIALDRDGRRLVIAHRDSPHLLVVDTATLAIERRVYVGPGALAVAVDPRSERVYLARRGTRRLEVFEPGSWLPIETLDVGGDATFLAVDRDEGALLAAIPSEAAVRVVQFASGKTTAVADLGVRAAWIDVVGTEAGRR